LLELSHIVYTIRYYLIYIYFFKFLQLNILLWSAREQPILVEL
jgi:hypothetical protein